MSNLEMEGGGFLSRVIRRCGEVFFFCGWYFGLVIYSVCLDEVYGSVVVKVGKV